MSAAFEIIFFKERRLRMSAALNSVIIFRCQNGDILWQRHLKLVYFIVKSSWYNSQIKYFFKERRPDWTPPSNERRIWSSENLNSAAALKRVKTVQILHSTLLIGVFQWLVTYCYFRNTLSILTQVTLNMPSYSIKTQIGTKWNRNIKTQIGTSLLSKI
jgi:hypothetical protein